MKICVLVKQVPDKNDEIKLNSENLSVDRSNFNFRCFFINSNCYVFRSANGQKAYIRILWRSTGYGWNGL